MAKICTALTNGPPNNDVPDHQPFTTLLLQLGGKSVFFALWWGSVKLCLLQSEVLLATFWNPLSTGEKTRQHITMGLSHRAATKPAAFSFGEDQLISDPYWRAILTQLHTLKCLLRSAAALIYTPSHGGGICPPHSHFTFCRPLTLPCCCSFLDSRTPPPGQLSLLTLVVVKPPNASIVVQQEPRIPL